MLAVGLALVAAFSFGLADFIGGSASRRLPVIAVLAFAQAVGVLAVGTVVAARGHGPPEGRYVVLSIGAGLVGAIGLATLYRALALGPMSIVAPIAGTAAVVPVLAGLALGETPSPAQNVGVVLALAGVALASRPAQTAGRARAGAGVWLSIVAAVVIGCFLVVLDAASEGDALWASLLQRTTSTAILWVALLALVDSPIGASGRDALVLALVGVLDVGGTTLFAIATTKGLVGVVSVLTSLYPVVIVALARFVNAERLTRGQAIGVAAAFGGVALLALG